MSQTFIHLGCQFAYTLQGAGPRVVFIQGVGVHGDGWLPQVNALAQRCSCLRFDNRGTGASQPMGNSLSVEQMAGDTLALMDHLGWDSAHLVGHSLGGLVALKVALTQRTRVKSLALLCTFANGCEAAPLTARMLWLGMRSRLGTRAMRRRGFLQLVMPAASLRNIDYDAMGQRLAPLFGHDLGDQPAIVGLQLKCMRFANFSRQLGNLDGLPTLVVSASEDPIAPPKLGRALSAGIAGARFVELADRSHGVPIHDPERINSLLEEHFATV